MIASDAEVEALAPALLMGGAMYRLWQTDSRASFPNAGDVPSGHDFYPPPTGVRFLRMTMAPDSQGPPNDLDFESALVELEADLPGMFAKMEAPANPRTHTTASIDFGYVIGGRCVLELDDGSRTELGAGDVYVQNGTRHSWWNPFDEPCDVMIVMLGADHENA